MLFKRRTSILLKNELPATLPRLVPSFSSKGFPLRLDDGGHEQSSVSEALNIIGKYMHDSMLLSAYDLHHEHFDKPDRFFAVPEVLIIDSGGYELSRGYDSTEPKQESQAHKKFDARKYIRVLKGLPKNLSVVITSFDHEYRGKPLDLQIAAAEELFNQFPRSLHDFLIKPVAENHEVLDTDSIIKLVRRMKDFDIIGVTEKELGRNLLERLINILKIRSALERNEMDIPIHVWGGLDPTITPLYFFAGADIFDGVSWLRYAYHDGIAMYMDAFGAIVLGVNATADQVRADVLNRNLLYLNTLTGKLKQFAESGDTDFTVFDSHAEKFREAHRVLITEAKRRR